MKNMRRNLIFISAAFAFFYPFQLRSDTVGLMHVAQKLYFEKKYIKAVEVYRQAASQGNPTAMFQIGAMLERGEGVARDLKEAANWYEKSAAAGSVSAAKRLANMYHDGEGVEKNILKSAMNYERAVQLGDAHSLLLLGNMYWSGNGVDRNSEKAVGFFEKAAVKGSCHAMNALAIAYRFGDGVVRSDVEAYAYFKLAAEYGDRAAGENFKQFVNNILPQDIKVGELRYKNLKSSIEGGHGVRWLGCDPQVIISE